MPICNEKMVSLGADFVLAFPVGNSHGTRYTMHASERAGPTVYNIT